MANSRPSTLLARSIHKKITIDNISWRKAAEQAQTTHSTLHRVSDGYIPDVLTLRNLCRWLKLDIHQAIEDLWGHYGNGK